MSTSNAACCNFNETAIQAKFISIKKSSTLPELVALRARAQQDIKDLALMKNVFRSSLAKRLIKLKNLAQSRGKINGEKQEKQALLQKIIAIDIKSKEILAQAQQEALETIEAVCISVFGQSSAIQKEFLTARLTQAFAKRIESGLTKVYVAKGFAESLKPLIAGAASVEENEQILAGQAVLETKSGKIEIDVMQDLIAAFTALNEKLNINPA